MKTEIKNDFDWDSFKKYVNSYDPKKHGLDSEQTIIKDMLYGLGICLDDKYENRNGFLKFLKEISDIINKKKNKKNEVISCLNCELWRMCEPSKKLNIEEVFVYESFKDNSFILDNCPKKIKL